MVFSQRTYSVLLVSAGEKFHSATMPLLPVTDFWPVAAAASAAQARRLLAQQSYDLVLINAPLPDESGTRLAIDICSASSAGVLLLVKNEIFEDIYAQTVEYGVVTVAKPTSVQMVAQSLKMLCATRERLRRVEERQATVEEKIEEIRQVNRAKWLLIERQSMTEAEAHRCIEKQAMDLRISKRQAAENIIGTYQ